MSAKETCSIASSIEVGSIVEIDWGLLDFRHKQDIPNGLYYVVKINYCKNVGNESWARGCDSCKGFLTVQNCDDNRLYDKICFGYSSRGNIFPFKSIKGNYMIYSEFDDLLNML